MNQLRIICALLALVSLPLFLNAAAVPVTNTLNTESNIKTAPPVDYKKSKKNRKKLRQRKKLNRQNKKRPFKIKQQQGRGTGLIVAGAIIVGVISVLGAVAIYGLILLGGWGSVGLFVGVVVAIAALIVLGLVLLFKGIKKNKNG